MKTNVLHKILNIILVVMVRCAPVKTNEEKSEKKIIIEFIFDQIKCDVCRP